MRNEIKQGPMAERLGISQGHLSAIEGGFATPGRDLAIRIEDATGIPVRDWSSAATDGDDTRTDDEPAAVEAR